jgi:hypothetical protein
VREHYGPGAPSSDHLLRTGSRRDAHFGTNQRVNNDTSRTGKTLGCVSGYRGNGDARRIRHRKGFLEDGQYRNVVEHCPDCGFVQSSNADKPTNGKSQICSNCKCAKSIWANARSAWSRAQPRTAKVVRS